MSSLGDVHIGHIVLSLYIPDIFSVLVTAFKDTILAECADLIKDNETDKLLQMYKVGNLFNDFNFKVFIETPTPPPLLILVFKRKSFGKLVGREVQ